MIKQEYMKPPLPRFLIGALTLLLFVILLVGSSLIKNQKKRLLKNKQAELTTIADLKAGQVTQWRSERINDAMLFQEDVAFKDLLEDLLFKTNNEYEKDALARWMSSMITHYDYKSIVLLNDEGEPFMAIPTDIKNEYTRKKYSSKSTPSNRKIHLSGFHKTSALDYEHFDLVVPLTNTTTSDSTLIGTLLLRIDPSVILYPLLQFSSTLTKSGETFLAKISGDSINYLSELRFKEIAPLNSSYLFKGKGIPPYITTASFEGIVHFNDYRNVPVLAAIKNVGGTDWTVVSKIDEEELLSTAGKEILSAKIILGLFIVSIIFLGSFSIWIQRTRFYRRMYKAEAKKQAIIKHFEYVLKYANDIILLIDHDLNIVEVNDKAVETYGYSRSEIIGMKVVDLRAPSTYTDFPRILEQIQKNESSTYETIHRRKDGSEFPIEMSSRVFEVEGSKYYHAIGRDIAERKRIEEKIREGDRKMNTLVNNLKGVIFNCEKEDNRRVITYVNGPIAELTGFGPEYFVNKDLNTFTSLINPADFHRTRVEIMNMLRKGPEYSIEYRINGTRGKMKWVLERGSGIIKDNELVSFEGFIIDVTDRKLVEEELIKAKEKAEESDNLKTAFLHNISHEIRTPMNAIVGFTTLLDTPDLPEDAKRQYMDIIFQGSNQLLSIITDIIDVSNIEIGQIKLSVGIINLNIILQNLNDQFATAARQQKIELNYCTSLDDNSAIVVADGTKLIQVLNNLINNAIKFTQKGKIEFGYSIKNDAIEFYVRDTGIGIKSDLFGKIFDRFYQIENPRTKQYSGTGLGLSISKAYIELMGGKIWLTSTPGSGSTFYFTIPYNTPSQKKTLSNSFTGVKLEKVSGKTILVAEDDKINFMLVREILSRTGIKILWAINGEEAVEACRANENIDLILMDIKMPLMDGYEALKIIKEFRPVLPIIALTAYAHDSDKVKALSEGFTGHVPKPIDRTDLYSALQKFL